MTNGWIDIKNTDMMLIMGGNPAENHPCGFKWAIEAKIQRNAKTIVVDPRLTRTAATADLYLQIRAGADIAFLGGVINYALANILSITPMLPSSLRRDSSFLMTDCTQALILRRRCMTNLRGTMKKVET
jgi:anaerobic selenocysteine-containing dehydrogenase